MKLTSEKKEGILVETERSLTKMGLSPHEKAFGEKLTTLGARVIVYYLRDPFPLEGDFGRPYAAVALLIKANQVVARGFSICNPRDTFLKRVGRAKAIGYAIKAYTRETNSLPVPKWWKDWQFMSVYLPVLLPYEKELMDRFGKEKLND